MKPITDKEIDKIAEAYLKEQGSFRYTVECKHDFIMGFKAARSGTVKPDCPEPDKWRFSAYKSLDEYESNDPYLTKDFSDYEEMKAFSGKHSKAERLTNPHYVSTYLKLGHTRPDCPEVDGVRHESGITCRSCVLLKNDKCSSEEICYNFHKYIRSVFYPDDIESHKSDSDGKRKDGIKVKKKQNGFIQIIFPENGISYMQDHRFPKGLPSGVKFIIAEYTDGERLKLVAKGYGALSGNKFGLKYDYGNGAIWISLSDLPKETQAALRELELTTKTD